MKMHLVIRLDYARIITFPMTAELIDCWNRLTEEGQVLHHDWAPQYHAAWFSHDHNGKRPEFNIEVIDDDELARRLEAGDQLVSNRIAEARAEQRALMMDPQPEVEVA